MHGPFVPTKRARWLTLGAHNQAQRLVELCVVCDAQFYVPLSPYVRDQLATGNYAELDGARFEVLRDLQACEAVMTIVRAEEYASRGSRSSSVSTDSEGSSGDDDR